MCTMACGPNAEWCDFTGWICIWDDQYYLELDAVKAGEYWIQRNSACWFGDTDEVAAKNAIRFEAAEECDEQEEDMDALECLFAQNPGTLSCSWYDKHCVDWWDAYTCREYDG